MTYRPDSWCIVQISVPGQPVFFKVGAGWAGGYTQGRSWKLNSGIKSYSFSEERIGYLRVDFLGESGSIYSCLVKHEGADWYLQNVIDSYAEELGHDVFKIISFEEFQQKFVQEGS